MIFGNKIRELREAKGLLLRQLAASLEIDTATISKIERGSRNATKEQVNQIAQILEVDRNEMLTLWLADQLFKVIEGEPMAMKALDIVKTELKK